MENGHVLDALDDRNGPIFLKCMIIFALAFLADNLIKLHPRSDFCHRISKHAISISRKYIEHVLAFLLKYSHKMLVHASQRSNLSDIVRVILARPGLYT